VGRKYNWVYPREQTKMIKKYHMRQTAATTSSHIGISWLEGSLELRDPWEEGEWAGIRRCYLDRGNIEIWKYMSIRDQGDIPIQPEA
jgi:hypothetical protein